MPMHLMGMLGMPRRIYTYQPQYGGLNHIASAGAAILGVAMLIFFINIGVSLRKGRRAPGDPWDHEDNTRTLEWTVESPPPAENFHKIPVIR
jgi:heme/copper-type cytochrome/quinol oxidase subunit 1